MRILFFGSGEFAIPTLKSIAQDGHDIVTGYRAARSLIGLVPQELTADMFETVWATVSFSRGLWGKWENPAHIESVLKSLSLWDKKDSKLMTLSGGMKRRVLIAKASMRGSTVLNDFPGSLPFLSIRLMTASSQSL